MGNARPVNRFKKFIEAYEALCKPYCQEIGISVRAFEILLFIAKSEGIATAQDICKQQNIKPTLMSFHIEKLVQSGYVERQAIDGNRRSIKLVCTDRAAPIIRKGAEIHNNYLALIWDGVSDGEKECLFSTLDKINKNADAIIKGNI